MNDAARSRLLVRGTVITLVAAATVTLSACAPTWERAVPAIGYAMCSDDPELITITYESGRGVESAEARQAGTLGQVFLSVYLTGSGAYPADASPATLVARLDGPLYDRSVVTLDGQPVPQVDC
ncbi:hypothetical protein [Microbacterium oleivorans]|uniref:Lipoprotein n=1 Tax=Microbacterium oleivorans TaxID=273677 RepID=A0A031FPJ6_9MICO|nr:hypothetical protein [Microbacterium oleivorans]EZP26754.1 hypothetical protein BW34_01954 [Microbacterium oleivorans]